MAPPKKSSNASRTTDPTATSLRVNDDLVLVEDVVLVEEEIVVDMRLFEWDKTYLNPRYGMCRPQVDFPAILSLFQQGRLKIVELVTRTYALSEVQQAFDDMLAGVNAKGVLLL